METLHTEPSRDQFKSESPIRAFTDWSTQGNYALGKGFRPSLAHVVPYMDAMEAKEGWRLVQILEAGTQTPSFVFRREREPSIDELLERLAGPVDEGFRQQVREWLNGEKPFVHPERSKAFAYAASRIDSARALSEHMDAMGYRLQRTEVDGHLAFRFTGRPLSEYDPAEWAWTQSGSDIDIPISYHEAALRYIAEKRDMDADRLVKDFMLYFKARNQPNQRSHKTFYRQIQFILPAANPVDLKRLIDQFRVLSAPIVGVEPERPSVSVTMDEIKPENLYAAFTGEAYDPEATSERKVGKVPELAMPFGANSVLATETPRFDAANPVHYNGWECGDIGERLSPNGYQILKYVWRLGKKDDPCVEIGKAIRYCEREMDLLKVIGGPGLRVVPNFMGLKPEHYTSFLEDRIAEQPTFTQNIARMLWNDNGYNRRRLQAIHEALCEHKFHLDCGRGLAI